MNKTTYEVWFMYRLTPNAWIRVPRFIYQWLERSNLWIHTRVRHPSYYRKLNRNK